MFFDEKSYINIFKVTDYESTVDFHKIKMVDSIGGQKSLFFKFSENLCKDVFEVDE